MMSDFDSNKYWQERHEKFGENSQGVGNVTYSRDENDEIYIKAQARLSQIIEIIDPPKGSKVLDLGCGIGLMAGPFLDMGIDYFGVDISDVAIDIATKSYPSATFICDDIGKLNLELHFDLVLERTVFIHLVGDEQWFNALNTVKKHLKKNGIFVLQDTIPLEMEQPTAHVKFRSISEYEKAFRELGLNFDNELETEIGAVIPSKNLRYVRNS